MSGEPGEIDADFDEIRDIPFAVDEFIVEHPDGEIRVEVDFNGKRRTVEPRETFPFEDQLIENLTENKTDNDRKGANIPVKGPWIHGWLEEKGADYIANIFRNYQYFLKYVQGRTENIQNVGTVNRSPGTYDSMYNYLMVLEKLGLVERFKREEIPEGEFDHPIPDNFEDRTFLRVTAGLEEEREKWRNPYKAKYPDLYGEEETQEQEIERPEPEEPDELGEEQTDDTQTDEASEEQEIEDVNTVDDFENPSGFSNLIDEPFEKALQEVLDDPPAPRASEGINVEDFSVGRIGIYGVWATGGAEPGQSGVQMLFELINESAPRSPQFIPLGLATTIEKLHNTTNPIPEVFTSYEIDGIYKQGFDDEIAKRVQDTKGKNVYYELRSEEFIEI